MERNSRNTAAPVDQDKGAAGQPTEAGEDAACRCKETSAMSPRELLQLMMNDLAVWTGLKKK